MFDAEADALSMYSRSSRMPSLIMQDGMSMQDYYAALQSSQGQHYAPPPSSNNNAARPRRNSGSSIMSDTERLYGWSGSRGGVSNEHQAPRYRIDSAGKLVLGGDDDKKKPTAAPSTPTNGRPVIKSARSEGAKPRYRPAFAPSADLPPSEDEREDANLALGGAAVIVPQPSAEDDDLDRVIQHDLPTTRPLKSRSSLKQKLGSVLARVGSRRAGGSTPPASSPGREGGVFASGQPQDYLSVKRANTTAGGGARSPGGATSPGTSPGRQRPDFGRRGTSTRKEPSLDEKAEFNDGNGDEDDGSTTPTAERSAPVLNFSDGLSPASAAAAGGSGNGSGSDRDDTVLGSGGGFSGLARKLSRRATTGGGSKVARSRSVARDGAAERERERERKVDTIMDKAAAEKMLKDLAQIPLYRPPRSAMVQNRKPLSSFPPRAPLQATTEANSLANAPRYHRTAKDSDGPRRTVTREPYDDRTLVGGGNLTRSNTTAATGKYGNSSRGRSGSTPSTYSTAELLPGNNKGGRSPPPPVPALPELMSDAPNRSEWLKFRSDSYNSLNKQA